MQNKYKYSLKKSIISTTDGYIDTLTKMSSNNSNKLILFTSIGTITGRLSNIPDSPKDAYTKHDDNTFAIDLSMVASTVKSFHTKLKDEENKELEQTDDTSVIYLADCEIMHTDGSRTSIPSMYIFTDQIIGVSVGNLG